MNTKQIDLLILPSVENIEEVVKGIDKQVNLVKGNYSDIQFYIKNDVATVLHINRDIKTFSFAWLSSYWNSRALMYGIKLYLDFHKIPHTFTEKNTSKLTDLIQFAFHNLKTPTTAFVDNKKIKEYIHNIEDTCKYPIIIKDVRGSGGKHSELVNNRDELISKISSFPKNKKFFFQEFIPNEYDWGILVANGEVVSGEKSYPKEGEYRNNALNGATEIFVDVSLIPENIKNIAIKASKILGLTWSRSDIIINKNTQEAYLLEVNRTPGLTSGSAEVKGAQTFLNSQLSNIENS